jgi:hypothetical protein
LENKIYFSPQRNDILFFGLSPHHSTHHQHQKSQQEAIKSFLNACVLVSPSSTGFGCVKRLAVQKGLFTSGGRGGGKATELLLRIFWDRVRKTFTSVEEVVFVECGEDALFAFEGNGGREEREEGWIGEGVCWPGDELGVWCWEMERFGEMVGRVVGCVEGEWGWVAPRWRVVESRKGEVEMGRRKEEGLVRRMRELFGHEAVSNAM